MKKLSKKLKNHLISSQRKKIRKEIRAANKKKYKLGLLKIRKIKYYWYFKLREEIRKSKEKRRNLKKQLYKRRIFNDTPVVVHIDKEFGIEEQSGIEYYLEKAASFIDLSSKDLRFDLTHCNRIWPSGIVLLCSLKQWIELTSKSGQAPKISSSPSNDLKVNSYLGHCGFYD